MKINTFMGGAEATTDSTIGALLGDVLPGCFCVLLSIPFPIGWNVEWVESWGLKSPRELRA
jgi:hypothetical protein